MKKKITLQNQKSIETKVTRERVGKTFFFNITLCKIKNQYKDKSKTGEGLVGGEEQGDRSINIYYDVILH